MVINATTSASTIPTGTSNSTSNKTNNSSSNESNTNTDTSTAEKTTSTNPTSLSSILGKGSASSGSGAMMASALMPAIGQLLQAFSGMGAEEASEEEGEKSTKNDKKGFNQEYSMQEANAESMQEHEGSFSIDQVQGESIQQEEMSA